MDNHYINPKLVRLYDLDSGWSVEREFYLSLAGDQPKNVLDLGCGTGLICNALAAKGHNVTGADPAGAMLDAAKAKPNGTRIDWVQSTAQNFKSDKLFDLIIMTGNAFQVFLKEADLQKTFQVMATHLKPSGLIAFETRNPSLDWKDQWDYDVELKTPEGSVFESRRCLHWDRIHLRFELRYRFPHEELISQSELRFWSPEEIEAQLTEAGLYVERLMGDWNYADLNRKFAKEMIFFLRKKA